MRTHGIQIHLTPDDRARVTSKIVRKIIDEAPDVPPVRMRTALIKVRVTPEQKAKYARLGGAEWVRGQLRGKE